MQNREMSFSRRAARENERRVERAVSALATYHEITCSWQDTLIDLLTDLRHWAAMQKLDFDQCDRIAAGHFAVEQDEASGVPC